MNDRGLIVGWDVGAKPGYELVHGWYLPRLGSLILLGPRRNLPTVVSLVLAIVLKANFRRIDAVKPSKHTVHGIVCSRLKVAPIQYLETNHTIETSSLVTAVLSHLMFGKA